MECNYCGHTFEPTEKEEKEAIIIELQKMSYKEIQEEIKTADFTKLEAIAEAKGYKKTWIYHHLKTIKDIQDYAKFKNYSSKWVHYQISQRQK